VRRAVLLAAAAGAAGLAGCGAAEEQPARVLGAWEVPEIYLPPPAPAPPERRDAEPPAPRTQDAPKPGTQDAPEEPASAGAPTDAEVEAELEQAFGSADVVDRASLTEDGLAQPPASASARLRALIRGANEVARKPYVYGGGHGGGPEGVFTDSAYDCSGSISYALASAGLVEAPMASGPMMTWGRPGPGKWVTIYANEGHAYMVVAGLRFDTSGRAERDTRWQAAMRPAAGFVARHPPGL
jgi:cell wall-associated NlpC family hydrolase